MLMFKPDAIVDLTQQEANLSDYTCLRFSANTICDSVNFDLFMAIMSFPASRPAFSILFWPGL